MQAVTCLAFSDSGAVLVTGGEDTMVNAWLLADVLDAIAGQQLQVGPARQPTCLPACLPVHLPVCLLFA